VYFRPPRLRRGDTIGVIAPAGVVDEAALRGGIDLLERAGFRVRLGDAVLACERYLAGDDVRRAADWHAMVDDDDVAAVFCARGGYGSGRLLPLLDVDRLRHRPKAFVGHSDATFLLNDLLQRAGVVTFHGPMVSFFARQPDCLVHLLPLLEGEPPPTLTADEVWREGEAEGVVVGGCLSIVAASMGTPYAVDTRGAFLFLEDVNERPYRVDRMLTQLRQAGALDEIAGLIFGEMPGTFDDGDVTLADVVQDVCGDLGVPMVAGVPSGHGRGLLTLPFGVRTRLCGAEIAFLEPAVQ
jgi:muramoyltetrapeptide carboxypeptidase